MIFIYEYIKYDFLNLFIFANFILILLLGIFFSSVFKYPLIVWTFIGNVLSKVISKIILFLIYTFLLLPFSFVKRLFIKDEMKINFTNKKIISTWQFEKEKINFDDQF